VTERDWGLCFEGGGHVTDVADPNPGQFNCAAANVANRALPGRSRGSAALATAALLPLRYVRDAAGGSELARELDRLRHTDARIREDLGAALAWGVQFATAMLSPA
jgi:hypothetical protein